MQVGDLIKENKSEYSSNHNRVEKGKTGNKPELCFP
jgi:hypothetical protein